MTSASRWRAAAEADLAAPGIHVWLVRIDGRPAPSEWELLSQAELRRARAFHTDALTQAFVASHAALRRVLGRHLGVAPSRLDYAEGAWRKPVLSGDGAPLHFNLSHSGPWALVAASTACPVGVDVEVRAASPPLDVARIAFSPDERRKLEALPADRQSDAFYALWTRKEAAAKGTGQGVHADFPRLAVSADPTAMVSLASFGCTPEAGSWIVFNLPEVPGAAAALASPVAQPVHAWRYP